MVGKDENVLMSFFSPQQRRLRHESRQIYNIQLSVHIRVLRRHKGKRDVSNTVLTRR